MRALILWVALMLLLAVEFFVARSQGGATTAPFIGLAMAVIVAFGFMRLRAAPQLAGVFALAGVFWLAVLMGLGSLDRATRQEIRIPYTSQR